MQTIYEELLQRVEWGENFSINLPKRNLRIGKEYLIKDGEYAEGRILYGMQPYDIKAQLEQKYREYKYSFPSKQTADSVRGYFKALSADEMTTEQMIVGSDRKLAQAALEGFILCAVVMNHIKWSDLTDCTWYWQSKNEPDLVILRQWIEGRNK